MSRTIVNPTAAEEIKKAQTAAIKAGSHTPPPLGVVATQVSRGETAPKPDLLNLISECGVDPKDTASIAAIIGGSPALAAACLNDDANKKVVTYLEECCKDEKSSDRKDKLIEGFNDLDRETRSERKDKLIDAVNSLDGKHLEEIDGLRQTKSLGKVVTEPTAAASKQLTAVERLNQERARRNIEGEKRER